MAVVPSVSAAAVQAIPDRQVRDVLRAITDILAVRNGDIGSGDEAFLTLADLKNPAIASNLARAVAAPIALGISEPGSDMEELAIELENRILASAAWQALFSRLRLIDAPDTTPGSAAYNLLQEAKARQASVTRVEVKTQTVTESLASTKELLTAAIGENAAAIVKETRARADADTATAEEISTLITNVGLSFAGVNSALSVKTNNDNALAAALNTIWAKVGSNTALVQTGTNISVNPVGSVVTKFDQLQATTLDPVTGLVAKSAALRTDMNVVNTAVDGLRGKWGVKLDLNGYVVGLSLNSGVSTGGKAESSFYVLADTFAVGAPGKSGIVPFAIDAQTGLVAIRGNLVARGSITGQHLGAYSVDRDKLALKAVGGAQIDDLAVDTLKIGRNAVTVPLHVSGFGGYSFPAGSSKQVGQVTATFPDDVEIVALVSWQAQAPGVGGNTGVELRVGGTQFHYASDSNINGYALSHATSGRARLGRGTHTFTIHFNNDWNQGTWNLARWSVTLLGVMR